MPSKCAIQECKEQNDNTVQYTTDWGSVRYYCDKHWKLMGIFFSKIGARACKNCKRNHHVETDSSYFEKSTVKFYDKYWNLCTKHIGIYEDAIDYFKI